MQLQQPIGSIRLGESFHYAQEIARPFGQIDRVIEWCKTELVGDWRWQVVTPAVTVPQDAISSTLTQTVTLPRLHCSGPKNQYFLLT
jgi:hypothetical protein